MFQGTLQRPTTRSEVWRRSSSVISPAGLVKLTSVASRRAALDLARDREHHGDRAQGLGEAADAGRLLPDQPEGAPGELVAVPRLLPADAQLRDHERRARERVGRVGRPAHLQIRAGGLAHAPREAPDDLEPLLVRVEQDELARRQPIAAPQDSVDELRRVGGAAAYDADLHEAGAYALRSPPCPRRRRRTLVVSTHFDDAALSLAHLLQQAGERGDRRHRLRGRRPRAPAGERLGCSARASRAVARPRAPAGSRTSARARSPAPATLWLRHLRRRPTATAPLRAARVRAAVERAAVRRRRRSGFRPASASTPITSRAHGAAPARVAAAAGPRRVYADLPYAGLHGFALPRAVARALPRLRARYVHLRGEAFERKLEAVRCHASQLIPLGDGAAGLLDAGRRAGARALTLTGQTPFSTLSADHPWQIPLQASSCRSDCSERTGGRRGPALA